MKFSGPLPFVPHTGQFLAFTGSDPVLISNVHAIAPETLEGEWEFVATAFTNTDGLKADHLTNLTTSLHALGYRQVEE